MPFVYEAVASIVEFIKNLYTYGTIDYLPDGKANLIPKTLDIFIYWLVSPLIGKNFLRSYTDSG